LTVAVTVALVSGKVVSGGNPWWVPAEKGAVMNAMIGSRRMGGLIAMVVILVLAGAASGATAATLITGKQIKDNTVASVDIRDNTVTSVDIKKNSIEGTDIENGTISRADLAANATWNDVSVDGHVLAPTIPGTSLISTSAGCVGYDSLNTSVFGSLALPVGATITGFDATWVDDSATGDVQIKLWRRLGNSFEGVSGGSVTSSGSSGVGTSASVTLSEKVDPGEQFLVEFIFPTAIGSPDEGGFCGMELHLS
jgi:hypothetical protein